MSPVLTEISVVICAYTEKRWTDLLSALASLRQQTLVPFETIVVIDHNPLLLERVRREVPGVTVVENGEARGLSGARNSGIRVAHGEVIAFMDEDASAAPDWIERLSQGYGDGGVLGVGGKIQPHWLSGRPAWFPDEFDWVVGCTYRGMPETAQPVRNLIGCNMSFRKEIFEEVGGFRNGMGRLGTLPLGCEETELCIRAIQQWKLGRLIYEPLAAVSHRVPPQRSGWRYFFSRCYSEGLSKALVARWVGAGDGLSNERAYTFRTLPRGAARGIQAALLHGDLAGLGRTAAIVSGLGVTTAGYLVGRISNLGKKRDAAPSTPALITKEKAHNE